MAASPAFLAITKQVAEAMLAEILDEDADCGFVPASATLHTCLEVVELPWVVPVRPNAQVMRAIQRDLRHVWLPRIREQDPRGSRRCVRLADFTLTLGKYADHPKNLIVAVMRLYVSEAFIPPAK